MKNLTQEEFNSRIRDVQRSWKIFKHLTANNLTNAFLAYQEILAKDKKEMLDSDIHGARPRTPIDNFERPKCPDCGTDMMFRQVPENEEGILIQLVCENNLCDTVLNSSNDMNWWIKKLKLKDSRHVERTTEGT